MRATTLGFLLGLLGCGSPSGVPVDASGGGDGETPIDDAPSGDAGADAANPLTDAWVPGDGPE
ncbi:MAG: hypothetical protein H0T42_11285, partial [Deltaproteobacteria bacterium]|nr:hypothetical protein [Deltaproteobacteria bacterium]